MTRKIEIHGRAVSFEIYELDEATMKRIAEGEAFHPFSYIGNPGPARPRPQARYFGSLQGAKISIGQTVSELKHDDRQSPNEIKLKPNTLVVAQGFEGAIFEGEISISTKEIPGLFERLEIAYPDGERLTVSLLNSTTKELQACYERSQITPLRFRLIDGNGVTLDMDQSVEAHREKFEEAIVKADHTKIREMVASGFSPRVEYSGEDFTEIPQLFCRDVETYKLLETMDVLVQSPTEVPETILAIEAFASGQLGIEVLRYIAEHDGALNRDWNGNDGRLAIHTAVATGDLEVVRLIFEAGADLHIASNDGETALGLALDQENSGIVTFLLSQGASLNLSDYRQLDLDGYEVEIDDPRDSIRSPEMEMLVRQFG